MKKFLRLSYLLLVGTILWPIDKLWVWWKQKKKIKPMQKLSYEDTIRKAAYDSLCTTRKLTGTMRRRLLRATYRITPVQERNEPLSLQEHMAKKFTRRPIAQLGNWQRRVATRLARVTEAIEAAIELNMRKTVDTLSVKRDRMADILAGLRYELSFRADRATFNRKTGKYVTAA